MFLLQVKLHPVVQTAYISIPRLLLILSRLGKVNLPNKYMFETTGVQVAVWETAVDVEP